MACPTPRTRGCLVVWRYYWRRTGGVGRRDGGDWRPSGKTRHAYTFLGLPSHFYSSDLLPAFFPFTTVVTLQLDHTPYRSGPCHTHTHALPSPHHTHCHCAFHLVDSLPLEAWCTINGIIKVHILETQEGGRTREEEDEAGAARLQGRRCCFAFAGLAGYAWLAATDNARRDTRPLRAGRRTYARRRDCWPLAD